MQQAKFVLPQGLIEFLNHHDAYGFKSRSEMVRAALFRLQNELELQELRQSVDLYAELYKRDKELQALTESALG